MIFGQTFGFLFVKFKWHFKVTVWLTSYVAQIASSVLISCILCHKEDDDVSTEALASNTETDFCPLFFVFSLAKVAQNKPPKCYVYWCI